MKCPMCGGPLTWRRDTCSDRCRQRLSRARRAARQRKAADLLRQQGAALASGDFQVAAELQRQIARLVEA